MVGMGYSLFSEVKSLRGSVSETQSAKGNRDIWEEMEEGGVVVR